MSRLLIFAGGFEPIIVKKGRIVAHCSDELNRGVCLIYQYRLGNNESYMLAPCSQWFGVVGWVASGCSEAGSPIHQAVVCRRVLSRSHCMLCIGNRQLQ